MSDEEKRKKDRECLHCKRFFDCDGKPENVKECIGFEERKEKENV